MDNVIEFQMLLWNTMPILISVGDQCSETTDLNGQKSHNCSSTYFAEEVDLATRVYMSHLKVKIYDGFGSGAYIFVQNCLGMQDKIA